MSFYSQSELEKLGFKKLGKNISLSSKASIYGAERISIGNNSRIDDFCIISAGEDGIEIGCNVHIACYSSLIGKSKIIIEDFVNISSRVSIYSSSDDYSGTTMSNPTIPDKYKNVTSKAVSIGKHSIIGSGSVILPGVKIGECSAVGALSLVNENIANETIAAGVPAKKIKDRKTDLYKLEKQYLSEIN